MASVPADHVHGGRTAPGVGPGFGRIELWATEIEHTTPHKSTVRVDAVLQAPDHGLPALLVEVDLDDESSPIVAKKVDDYRAFFEHRHPLPNPHARGTIGCRAALLPSAGPPLLFWAPLPGTSSGMLSRRAAVPCRRDFRSPVPGPVPSRAVRCCSVALPFRLGCLLRPRAAVRRLQLVAVIQLALWAARRFSRPSRLPDEAAGSQGVDEPPGIGSTACWASG